MKKSDMDKNQLTDNQVPNNEISENANKTTEIAVIEKKEKKPAKTKKVSKKNIAKIPRKKLPKIYKKKYSPKKLKKKLLSKIFIADDKKYVESLFTEIKVGKKEKTFYRIPDEKLFTPVESKRLKVLAKQIKKQKGTVKFIPLIVLIGIIACVFIFTDLILKIGLKSTCQKIFNAKTEIGYAHLDYLDSSLTLKNFVVANKDEPMTNLFEFESIVLDIDINRLLEKSVVIDEIEAAGFKTGTERKTSGALPVKVKKEKEKDKAPKEPLLKPEFVEGAKNKVTGELQALFEKFNPETIINSLYNSLQTPIVSKNISTEMATLIPYWQSKPDEISKEVSDFIKKSNSISSINFSNIKDVTQIQKNIDTITSIIKDGENLTNSFKTTYSKLDTDFKSVKNLTANLEKAIQSDTKMASNITSSIKNFTPKSGMRILSNTIEDFLNNLLGNLYPTIKEVLASVDEIKAKLPEKTKAEKPEEKKIERLKGTNFTWGRPEMPQFYVGIAHASGSGFDVLANNISNNPKIIPEPMTLDGTYSIAGREDSFSATLDLVENSQNPMFYASYHAPEVPTSFDFLKSDSTLDIQLSVEKDKSISAYGNANIKNASVVIPSFEPAFAYSICEQAVNEIDTTYLGIMANYSDAGDLKLNVNTDFDNQFMKGVTNLVNAQLTSIKDKATKEIAVKLDEYSAPVKEKINEFNKYKEALDKSKKDLEQKIAELKAKLEDAKNKLIQSGKDKAESAISDTVNKYVDTDKLDSLKKLF